MDPEEEPNEEFLESFKQEQGYRKSRNTLQSSKPLVDMQDSNENRHVARSPSIPPSQQEFSSLGEESSTGKGKSREQV